MDTGARIREYASRYRDETAGVLSDLVRIESYSGREEQVCTTIAGMCRDYGFTDVRIDGLGAVILRVGNGPRILAVDENQAHAPNECARVDDLEICSGFYAMLPFELERQAEE